MKLEARNEGPTSNGLGVNEGHNGDFRPFCLRRPRFGFALEPGAKVRAVTASRKVGDAAKSFAGNTTVAMHGVAAPLPQSRLNIVLDAALLRDQSRSGTGLDRLG